MCLHPSTSRCHILFEGNSSRDGFALPHRTLLNPRLNCLASFTLQAVGIDFSTSPRNFSSLHHHAAYNFGIRGA
jgi:hypothetical protein